MSLFEATLDDQLKPLAERMRPKIVAEIVGQDHVLSPQSTVGQLLTNGRLMNLIVTGPPGTGKTSFAKAFAHTAKAHFIAMNAVDAGVKDLKQAGEEGRRRLHENSEKTILFVDEIHRFNRGQQDVLLPFLEKGELYLVGATTEHPSYELNRALISRSYILEFKRLEKESFIKLISQVEKIEHVDTEKILSEENKQQIMQIADGDGRRFLNLLEAILELYKINPKQFPLQKEQIEQLVGKRTIAYDKSSDQHYDCISAFIKSIRGSDSDAALYYLARMLAGGEDPVFVARRLIILASEDIGNAEPRALPLAVAVLQAVEAIGMPECAINLSQVVTFLASCPKSNRSYLAWKAAQKYVEDTGSPALPESLMSSSKADGTYKYPHDFDKAYVPQNYWPPTLKSQHFYEPAPRGQEKNIAEYIKWLKGNSY